MDFNFVPITEEHIRSIATWKYERIYSFYDQDAAPEIFFRGLERGRIFAVLDDEGSLAGYFGFTSEDSTVVLGLGLRPELTGHGLGFQFLCAGLQFACEHYAPTMFRLEVAAFNQRAIRVYELAGFVRQRNILQKAHGKEFDFVEMSRSASSRNQDFCHDSD